MMPGRFTQRWFSAALLAVSLVLCVVGLNFAAKLVYQSDRFQHTHANGLRVVEYVSKLRPDIYGEDSSIIAHPYLLYPRGRQ
jgi:hypothetical protein